MTTVMEKLYDGISVDIKKLENLEHNWGHCHILETCLSPPLLSSFASCLPSQEQLGPPLQVQKESSSPDWKSLKQ